MPRKREDTGRLRDPREGYVIAGVSNRDARAVYDARAEAMRTLWAQGAADEAALAELGGLLHDALRLSLWRARRVTGFDALVEQVVGLPADRARELVAAYSAESGEAESELNERNVAIWLRTEAGLFEGDGAARARIRATGGEPRLELSLRLSAASAGLAGVGARHAPLAREQAEGGGARSEGPTRARAEGGAKLLTRKRTAEPDADEAPELEVREQNRAALESEDDSDVSERAESAAPPARRVQAGERPLKRKTFGAAEARGAAREQNHEGRSFADRAERPNFAAKRGFGARREQAGGFEEKRGFDKPRFAKTGGGGFGDKRPASDRPAFGEQRGFAGKRSFGDKPAFAEQRGFGKKRSFGAEGSSDRRPEFKEKRSFGDKPAFTEKRGFGSKRGFGAKGAFAGKGGQGGGFRKSEGGFDAAPRGAREKPAFGKRGFGKRGSADKAGFESKGGFAEKRGKSFGAERASGQRGAGGFNKRFAKAGPGKGAKGKAVGEKRAGSSRGAGDRPEKQRVSKRRDDAGEA